MRMPRILAPALLLAASGLAVFTGMACAADESGGAMPTRGRAAALLTALFYHDASEQPRQLDEGISYPAAGAVFPSVPPEQALFSRERSRVFDFARSLIYEGGYYPKEIYQLLGYDGANTARIARLTRQLDQAGGKTPAPWEVAGRVGRSGISGSSDHWAMAPGGNGDADVSTPGTLAYLPTLAIVYAGYPADGREAAAQLAILKDDDLRAAPVARSAFSLLTRVLVAEGHDKDAWLRAAARDSEDSDTEHDLRAVRVKDWRYLRGEECAMGRLERAVHLWYKGESYDEIMGQGRELLRSRESLAYLASLTAVTYGMESLPTRVISTGATDRKLFDLINDLYDLATSEAVLQVAPED